LSDLVELKVGGLLPDGNNQGSHILLLKIPQSSRYLPIWIGPAEASSIAMVLRGQAFERPLTHDLLQHVIEGLDATVQKVVVTTIQDDTFFARIFLERGEEIVSIDARPSDCVALAVRVQCPIYCSAELLESQADHLVEVDEIEAEIAGPPPVQLPKGSADDALRELMRQVELGEKDPREDEPDGED
jgi:bifunctional DNase/RNase